MVNDELRVSPNFYAAASRYAAKYRDKTIVIKFGGELVAQDSVIRNLMVQAINLKNFGANVVLVHGGGRQIDDELKAMNLPKKERDNVRDTDLPTLEVTHRCLNELNRTIVNYFHEEAAKLGADISAIGLGGNDNRLIMAKERFEGSRTGVVNFVDREKLQKLTDQKSVPIIHPISMGYDGKCMNVNADEVAAAIAISLSAHRLILCSNKPGVLDKNEQRIPELYVDEIEELIANGTIFKGMVPKARAAAETAKDPAVGGVVILDGADTQSIEDELLTDAGAGTLIRRSREAEAVLKL